MEPSDWIAVATGVPTLFIAVVVAGVTVRQYFVAQDQLRLSLFEKRLHVYSDLRQLLAEILSEPDKVIDGMYRMRHVRDDAEFLFGEDVTKYLDELMRHMISWSSKRHILSLNGIEESKRVSTLRTSGMS